MADKPQPWNPEQSSYDEGYRDGESEVAARIKALVAKGIERDEQGYRNAASDALLAIRAELDSTTP